MFGRPKKIPCASEALPGRTEKMPVVPEHKVLGTSMIEPFPPHLERVLFGLGCFWGAEQKFWGIEGVYVTAVGYAGGHTPNPTYQEVCTGKTGHNEVAFVVYDPALVSFQSLLNVFWESHDPTQGMRQGNDQGTQYRSGIYYTTSEQSELAKASLKVFQLRLNEVGFSTITTEICPAGEFYYAEEYHQQYLEINPTGYCGIRGTGVSCL